MLYEARLLPPIQEVRVPKGTVSAYRAAKDWKVSQATVEKWIGNGKIRGFSKDLGEGIVRYFVYESELEKVKKKLKNSSSKGRERGHPLL